MIHIHLIHLALEVVGAAYLIVYGTAGLIKLVRDAYEIFEKAAKHLFHLK